MISLDETNDYMELFTSSHDEAAQCGIRTGNGKYSYTIPNDAAFSEDHNIFLQNELVILL